MVLNAALSARCPLCSSSQVSIGAAGIPAAAEVTLQTRDAALEGMTVAWAPPVIQEREEGNNRSSGGGETLRDYHRETGS